MSVNFTLFKLLIISNMIYKHLSSQNRFIIITFIVELKNLALFFPQFLINSLLDLSIKINAVQLKSLKWSSYHIHNISATVKLFELSVENCFVFNLWNLKSTTFFYRTFMSWVKFTSSFSFLSCSFHCSNEIKFQNPRTLKYKKSLQKMFSNDEWCLILFRFLNYKIR